MILWVSVAFAGELSEPQAAEVARLFYRQTGRPVPEAFLGDDVEALIDSGYGVDELTGAVVWIARNVPGAESYTLAGILDSHLADALGFDEELVLPEGFDPDEVLGEAHERDAGWMPGPADAQALLEAFYVGTRRAPPSPPTDADLAGFQALADEGWTEAAVRTLVEWVPANLRGVEQLSWGQVAGLAADKGYLSGPRPNGEMESLQGVQVLDEVPARAWGSDRAPLDWDGGRARWAASMGALEGTTDRAAVGARLAGAPRRTLEVRGDAVGPTPTGAVTLSESAGDYGWLVEAGYGSTVPGRSWTVLPLDGGPARPDDLAASGRGASGRASVGHTLSHALGAPASIGAGAWGQWSPGVAEGGATASLGFGDTFQLLGHGSLGAVRQTVSDVEVSGQVAGLELTPRLELGSGWVEVHARGYWRSGGLLDDAAPIYDDAWSERRGGLELQIGREGATSRVAGGVATERGAWDLTWVERTDTNRTTRHAGDLAQSQVFVGGEANVWGSLWLTGGGRALFGDVEGFEVGAGARVNLNEISWLAAYGRIGQEPAVGVELGIPL